MENHDRQCLFQTGHLSSSSNFYYEEGRCFPAKGIKKNNISFIEVIIHCCNQFTQVKHDDSWCFSRLFSLFMWFTLLSTPEDHIAFWNLLNSLGSIQSFNLLSLKCTYILTNNSTQVYSKVPCHTSESEKADQATIKRGTPRSYRGALVSAPPNQSVVLKWRNITFHLIQKKTYRRFLQCPPKVFRWLRAWNVLFVHFHNLDKVR